MSARPIAFALHLSELANHYANIVRHLDPADLTLIDCAPAGSEESARIAATAGRWGVPVERADDALAAGTCHELVVSNQFMLLPEDGGVPGLARLGRRHVRLLYALGKTRWNLSGWNRFYDRILCFGPYQRALFEHAFPGIGTSEVGYPRFDHFFDAGPARAQALRDFGLDPARRTVVWLPTYASLSSIDAFADAIDALAGRFNVIVKAHPGTPQLEPARWSRLGAGRMVRAEPPDLDNVALFRIADFVLADYGGSAFGAIYTDRPTLLLNAPGDLFASDTGWLSADLQLRDHLPNLDAADADRIGDLLDDDTLWASTRERRSALRAALFAPGFGRSGQAAADAILATLRAPAGATRAREARNQDLPDSLLRLLPGQTAQWPLGYRWRAAWTWADERLRSLAERLAGADATIAALGRERLASDEARRAVETRLHATEAALATAEAGRAAAEAQARASDAERDAARAETAASRATQRELADHLDQTRARLAVVAAEHAAARDDAGNLRAELGQLRDALRSPRFLAGNLRRLIGERLFPRRGGRGG